MLADARACVLLARIELGMHTFASQVLNRKLMLVDEIKNDPRKDAQAYAERVARGFRPEIPKHWPPQLVELISSSWAQVSCRVSHSSVVHVLGCFSPRKPQALAAPAGGAHQLIMGTGWQVSMA
jgi:hypothetical protein